MRGVIDGGTTHVPQNTVAFFGHKTFLIEERRREGGRRRVVLVVVVVVVVIIDRSTNLLAC